MTFVFLIAIKAIFTNKVRSFLTMLGVIIGVFSVVMLTSIGNGLSAYVTEQFDQLGSNTLIVFPGDAFGEGGGFDRESQINAIANSELSFRDVSELRKLREHVELAVPFNTMSEKAQFLSKEETITVVGTTHEYTLSQGGISEVAKGSFFTKSDEDSAKKVIVIGHAIAEELFGNVDPVGKKISVGTTKFTIIGVMKEAGSSFGGPSFDTYAFIPIQVSQKVFDNENIVEIIVKAKNKDRIQEAIAAIERSMLKRHDEDSFSVFEQSQILETINQILSVLTIGLGGIAGISLLVGGIGIMNIMLVSVTERTREIGLRKAIGATPNLILIQFLIEAAILSVLGGAIGVGLAYAGTLIVQNFFPAKVTADSIVLAFSVSTAVGLIFGAAPARRAANLSPIEALRYE